MPDYGIESKYLETDSELFTDITNKMKEATKRSTYQPYFEMFQQGATTDYFNQQAKVGQTGSGNFSGFAGSSADSSVMDSMMQTFGKQMFKVERDIGQQQQKAETTINDIIQSNRQTALSLKQLEAGNEGGSDGTSFICGEIKKVGKMSNIESLKMMKFLLKSALTHPLETYWYVNIGKFIINEANKKNFDWSQDNIKKMFITDILALEDGKRHNRACWHYLNNCTRLAEMIGLSIVCPDSWHTRSLFNKIKGWWKLATKKSTWTFGIPYLKEVIINRKLI